MYRPYQLHTRDELGAEFAAAVRLGGRPIIRMGTQLSYADLALEIILEEFKTRAYEEERLHEPDLTVVDDDLEPPF